MSSSELTLSDDERATLESWTRCSTVRAGHCQRARIVLAIADGAGPSATARMLGVSRPTAIKWRERFAAHGLAGLDDRPRSGRPKTIDDAQIIAAVSTTGFASRVPVALFTWPPHAGARNATPMTSAARLRIARQPPTPGPRRHPCAHVDDRVPIPMAGAARAPSVAAMRRTALITTLALTLIALSAATAQATFPGRNGPILYHAGAIPVPLGTYWPLFSMRPDGTAERLLSSEVGYLQDSRADGRRLAYDFFPLGSADEQIATSRSDGSDR